MSAKDTFSSLGGLLVGLVVMIGFVGLAFLIIMGAGWASYVLLPWFGILTWLAVGLIVLVILPLAIPMATRGFAGTALLVSSHVFGITVWMHALVLTLVFWGPIAAFIGLFLAGVGILPIAILAGLFNGQWLGVLEIMVMLVMTFAARIGSSYLFDSVERHRA